MKGIEKQSRDLAAKVRAEAKRIEDSEKKVIVHASDTERPLGKPVMEVGSLVQK